MKKILEKFIQTILLFLVFFLPATNTFSQTSYGMTAADIEHENCKKKIDADYDKKQNDIKNTYYEDHKGTLLACDDHCPLYWCKKHHQQCNNCSCAFDYANDLKNAKSAYDLELRNCEATYKKAKEIEYQKEKKAEEQREKIEQQKVNLEQQSQEQLKQRQQQLEQQRQVAAKKQAEQEAIKRKIIDGQQQVQEQTNKTIQNSIQQGTDAITNYANFLANESAKKEAAKQKQEEYYADQEQKRLAQKQKLEYEKQQKEFANQQEINRQSAIDQQIIGNFAVNKRTAEVAVNVKQIYYITYERSYTSNKVYVRTYTINKYSDDTWMLLSDMLNKINFRVYTDIEGTKQLLGAFEKKQTALAALAQIKSSQPNAVIKNDFAEINENAATKKTTSNDKDFWNN